MISMGDEGITPRQRASQISAGLGLVRGVVVDQHFDQRSRYGRLMSVIAPSPHLLGIGIDEDTAMVVTDGASSRCGLRRGLRRRLHHRRHRRGGRPRRRPAARVRGDGAHPPGGRHVRPRRAAAHRLRRAAPRPARPRSPPPRPDPAPSHPTPPATHRHPRRSADGPSQPDRPRRPRPAHRRVARLPRRQHLVLRPVHPPRGRPRCAGGVPDRHPPGLHRPARRAAARAGEPHLLQGRQGRLHRAPARGHLGRARGRARRPAAAAGGRPRPAPREDPHGQGQPRRLQRHLQLHRRGGRPGGRAARGAPGQPPGRRRTRSSTSPPSSRPS